MYALLGSVVDGHHFDADPDPDWHQDDANPRVGR
jgi:hypothetical protein